LRAWLRAWLWFGIRCADKVVTYRRNLETWNTLRTIMSSGIPSTYLSKDGFHCHDGEYHPVVVYEHEMRPRRGQNTSSPEFLQVKSQSKANERDVHTYFRALPRKLSWNAAALSASDTYRTLPERRRWLWHRILCEKRERGLLACKLVPMPHWKK
jgi:hypothetical protein